MPHPEQDSKNSCTLPMLLVFMSAMGILVLLYFLSNLLSSVVILVCLAMVFAYILIIPVEWLEKLYEKGLQKNRTMAKMDKVLVQGFHLNARSLSVITVFLTFFLSTSLALILLAPKLTHQVSEFTQDLPGYVSRAEMHLIEWGQDALGPDAMKTLFPKETQGLEAATTPTLSGQPLSSSQKSGVNAAIHTSVFSTTVTQMVKILDHLVESTLENLIGVVTHTLTGLIYFISGLILLFYFLLDGNTIRNGLLSIIPDKALPSATYSGSNPPGHVQLCQRASGLGHCVRDLDVYSLLYFSSQICIFSQHLFYHCRNPARHWPMDCLYPRHSGGPVQRPS